MDCVKMKNIKQANQVSELVPDHKPLSLGELEVVHKEGLLHYDDHIRDFFRRKHFHKEGLQHYDDHMCDFFASKTFEIRTWRNLNSVPCSALSNFSWISFLSFTGFLELEEGKI